MPPSRSLMARRAATRAQFIAERNDAPHTRIGSIAAQVQESAYAAGVSYGIKVGGSVAYNAGKLNGYEAGYLAAEREYQNLNCPEAWNKD